MPLWDFWDYFIYYNINVKYKNAHLESFKLVWYGFLSILYQIPENNIL
jgi:hypothetical protein